MYLLVQDILVFPIAGGLTGLFYFGVPAFLLSVIYAVCRLYRVWHNFLLVALVGGSAAHLWVPIIFSNKYVQWERTDMFGAFLLGALSSLLMAYFVLPRKVKQWTLVLCNIGEGDNAVSK